jgi:hypothetical protein
VERWSEHQYAREVRSKSDFAEFVKVLRETERKPVMAISIAEDRSVPDVDVAALEQQLDDSVYFYVLPAQVTFWLTDELGDKSLSVHSGWVRVYPSARSWLDDPHLSPKFPPMPSNPRRAVERIVEAALTVAFKEGHTSVDVLRCRACVLPFA